MIKASLAPLSSKQSQQLMGLDPSLKAVIGCLLLSGIVMIYSAGIAKGGPELRVNTAHLIEHSGHVIIGLLMMLLIIRCISLPYLQTKSRPLLLLGLLSLIILFIPSIGINVNGSTRWLQIAGVRLQPAEAMKLLCLIYVADYYTRKHRQINQFKIGIFNLSLPILVASILLLSQPDYGTTVIILATTGSLMYLAGIRISHLTAVFICIALCMALIVYLEPYQINRLLIYQDPWADPFDKGFQITQSLMAIGRGGWLGVGLGNSLQKLNYLPHADNDFLIAIIGEELGVLGIFAVMLLFSLLLYRAFAIGSKAKQNGASFNAYLAYGVGLLLVFNAAIHIGVGMSTFPTKGLNLPLMSTGGSSMIISLMSLGLLFAVDKANRGNAIKARTKELEKG